MKRGYTCNTCGKGGYSARGLEIHFGRLHRADFVSQVFQEKEVEQRVKHELISDMISA